jgi:tetratricopeptide (TPR) repeat protein
VILYRRGSVSRRRRTQRPAGNAHAPRAEPRAATPFQAWAWQPALLVFVLALFVRLLHLWEIRHAPFFSLLMGDALGYDQWARRLAAGDWVGTGVFYQAPLYPYFLGVLYALGGHDPLVVRLCQAVLGAGACGLVALAGAHLFGRGAGLAAGALLALYAPAIFFDGLLQKTVLDAVFLAWLLVVLALTIDRVTVTRAAWAGVALGGLTLVRENALVFLPVLLLWVWLRSRRSIAPVLALALGTTVVLLPVAVRNEIVGGEFHLTTSQLGPNLYIGNHAGATGTYVPLLSGHGNVAYERQDATDLAEQTVGRSLGPGEVSRFWTRQAVEWVTSHPGAWLRLMGRKLLLVWNATEATDTEDLYTYADWSVPLRIASGVLHFGVLAPLAALGLWITRRRWRDLWPFYAMGAAYALSVAAFFVLGRYRYPLVPVLALFAGAACGGLSGWLKRSDVRERFTAAALVTLVGVGCNWPLLSLDGMRASTHYNIGYALQQAGRTEDALVEYRRALALQPAYPNALTNLGVLLAAKDDHDQAVELYREALALDPDLPGAHTNLGIELAARGQEAEAIAQFHRALELDPRDATAHFNLGTALALSRQSDEAIRHFREAIRLDPANARAHNNLGILLASAGRLKEAIAEFQTALRLRPDFAEAEANLKRAQDLARQSR